MCLLIVKSKTLSIENYILFFIVFTYNFYINSFEAKGQKIEMEETDLEISILYDDFIEISGEKLSINGNKFLRVIPQIKELDSTHLIYDLISNHYDIVYYLLSNWSSIKKEMRELYYHDSLNFPINYMEALKNDSLLKAVLQPLFGNFVTSMNGNSLMIEKHDSISWNEVNKIAVRFFYPSRINPDGSIMTHVCVGINGMKDLEGNRKPFVEALAYAALNRELRNKKSKLIEGFLEKQKQIEI